MADAAGEGRNRSGRTEVAAALHLGPRGDEEGALRAVEVVSVDGVEALSALFRFRVTASFEHDEVRDLRRPSGGPRMRRGDAPAERPWRDEDALIGRPAEIRFSQDGASLVRYGVVASAHLDARLRDAGSPRVRYSLEIVPNAATLRHRRNSRVFQDRYVHDIVSQILCEHRVRHAWSLQHRYPIRRYCVQFQESDWDFVTRLFAEEGILFWFRHGQFTPDARAEAGANGAAWSERWFMNTLDLYGRLTRDDEARGGQRDGLLAPIGELADHYGGHDDDPEASRMLTPGGARVGDPGPGDTLFFCDHQSQYELVQGDVAGEALEVALREIGGMAAGERHVSAITWRREIAATEVELRDHDFRRPLMVLRAHDASDTGNEGLGERTSMEVYEHHGEYEQPDVDGENANTRLEQLRARTLLANGKSDCWQLLPGHRFTLRDAGDDRPDGSYVVVGVRHAYDASTATDLAADEDDRISRAMAWAITHCLADPANADRVALQAGVRRALGATTTARYRNEFECADAATAMRPPRPERAPRTVSELATVVGPPGEEIHTDRYGRVKIQFHWDREHRWDDRSSCWVRVAQAWAGAGFGVQFVPRVGMQVLVSFLGGDLDRPVVTGCLYDGTHDPPDALPENRTRTVIRTQSSPGGLGGNELGFEDLAGSERVRILAQRDLESVVRNDRVATVRHDDTVVVGHDQRVAVANERVVGVRRHDTTVVGGTQAVSVGDDRSVRVARNAADRIDGDALRDVRGTAVDTVRGDEARVVKGDLSVAVSGSSITHVGGGAAAAGAAAVTHVQGDLYLGATLGVTVRAGDDGRVRIACGTSLIEVGPDRIELSADAVVVRGRAEARTSVGGSSVSLKPAEVAVGAERVAHRAHAGSAVELGSGATITGASGAKVTAPTIALETGAASGAAPGDDATQLSIEAPVTLRFTHLGLDDDEPLAGVPFVALVDDRVVTGTTSAQGEAVLPPPRLPSVTVLLRAHEVYPELYPPDEGPLHWLVHVAPSTPAAESLAGLRSRLKNLGYDAGRRLEDEELDAVTRKGLEDFQREHAVRVTGEADDETRRALVEASGR